MLTPGRVVERYRVELTLGEGGAATVYRVRHTTLGTLHALKVLHVTHPTSRARLLEEGRIQAHMRHPNVVAVTDVLEVEGAPALLLEFVGGGSLADRLRRGPIALDEALRLFAGVVEGVGYAHGQGMVHRDLKPANVLLAVGDDPGGARVTPKVTDFGIARLLAPEGASHTRSGVAMGTPAYMAPEQSGDARSVDARADVFSLGVMLYELVTGTRPFQADGPIETILAARRGLYPDPAQRAPGLPEPVRAAIRGCLQPDPDRRIPDCAALRATLSATLAEVAAGAIPPIPPIPPTAAPDGHPDRASASATFPDLEPPDLEPPDLEPPAAPPPTPTATGPSRSRAVTALVVDDRGEGHAVEVVVALSEGDGGVWAPDGVERDAAVAAQLAVAVALGAEARRWSVRWQVRGPGGALHGTSIGLAVAVATRAARLGQAVPDGWAYTGGLDLDEQVARVSGLPAKVRAAAAAGCRHIALPAAERAGLSAPPGVRLVPVRDFSAFAAELLTPPAPRPAWRRWGRLAALVVPVALALTELLAPVEAALQRPLLTAVRGALPADDVVILGVDAPDPRALRAQHPTTIRALCAAGATGVVFDLALSTPTDADAAIAAAAREAAEGGCPVALPVRFHWGEAVHPGTQALADATTLGLVESKHDLWTGVVRAAPARRIDPSGRSYWHLAALAAAFRTRPEAPPTPEVQGDTLVIGALRNPTWAGLIFPHPAQAAPMIPYGARDRFDEVEDRVVLVGAVGGSDDVHRVPGGRAYGVEILAGLTQTLIRQAALRSVPPEGSALAALLAGLGTAWLAALLPARRRAAALAITGGVLAAGLALAAGGVLVAFLPILLAASVGLWAARAARSAPGAPEPAGARAADPL